MVGPKVGPILRSWVFLLVAALTLAAASCEERAEEQGTALIPSQSRKLLSSTGDEEPLLVTTLDGKVMAVDKHSGTTLWSFDTESPLVSARASQAYGFSVVPGVQGELYTQERGLGGGYQMLPQTLPQWVEQTPSVMADGSLWLGSRHTHAFFMDGKTGKLIKSYVEYGDGPSAGSADVADFPEDTQPILIGRVDYTVRAIHQDTGEELFNVSYSHLMRLDSEQHLPSKEELPALDSPHDSADSLGVSVDPWNKHALRRVDAQTGQQLWSLEFEHPPVAVFAGGGEVGRSLYEEPSWPAKRGSTRFSVVKQPSIIIDRLGTSFYALPLPADVKNKDLKALLPVDSPHDSSDRDSQCSLQDDQSSSHGDKSSGEGYLWNPLGIHLLESSTSPLIAKRFLDANASSEGHAVVSMPWAADSDLERRAGYLGMMGVSLLSGGLAVAALITFKLLETPRVVASMKDRGDDITTLTLSYTGTLQEAEEARKNGQAVLDNSPDKRASTIRDWTGSGVGNDPSNNPEAQSEKAKREAAKNDVATRLVKKAKEAVEESPFSTVAMQSESQQLSNSDYSTESPKSGSKKRKKKKKASGGQQAVSNGGEADQRGGEAPSLGESDAERLEAEEEGSEEPEAEGRADGDAGIQATTAGRGAAENDGLGPLPHSGPFSNGASTSTNSSSAYKRSKWRDGVTYVGRLAISTDIVGYGSSGTLVFEGSLDGRQVAVKRVLRQFYELARKEIGALIVADEHPNIVRCFAMEEDTEFVYLALERCKHSLNDLLGGSNPEGPAMFVAGDGRPTDFCMQVCEEAGRGLMALHERGIIHRDLKPHNVLLTEGQRTKLSDMGLCKRLTTDQTSYDSAGPGGSTGWQAPEQLILRSGGEARQGRSVDTFAFGLLLFYCLTGGQHAFGEGYERDYRILNGRANLGALATLPEAMNLIRAALRPQPKQRPSMAAIMAHPFWWSPARKLAFLIDVSNRVENEDREVDRSLLRALEACSEESIGGEDWAQRLDEDFLANLGRYRKYNPGSLRDLLRVIRNKHNHFREMPEALQERLGPLPEAFLRYFTSRFPGLLLTTYAFAMSHCSEEPLLQQYFPPGAKDFPFASTAVATRLAQNGAVASGPPLLQNDQDRTSSAPAAVAREPPLATVEELRESMQRSKSDANLLPPPPLPREPRRSPPSSSSRHRGWWSSSESERSDSDAASLGDRSSSSGSGPGAPSASRRAAWQFLDPAAYGASPYAQRHTSPAARRHPSPGGLSQPPPPPPPLHRPPPGPLPYSAALLQGSSATADAGGPPPRVDSVSLSQLPAPDADGVLDVPDALQVAVPPPGTRMLRDPEGCVNVFPQRPDEGAPVCDFFTKTGHCKFGEACRFHHPLSAAVKLTAVGGYPLRLGQPVCPFYDRTGDCKYAASCKFHHPHVPACKSSSNSQQQSSGRDSSSQHPSSSSRISST